MIVDVNSIINGTPTKRITLSFNTMKETYNESSAEEFKSVYEKENLSDILDNSMYIFSECYKGLDFYKNIVIDPSSCIFSRFDDELDKVHSYIEENAENMNSDQLEKLNSLYNEMTAFKDKYKDVITVASFINEKDNEVLEREISNALYSHDDKKVIDYLGSSIHNALYVYGPYIAANESFNDRGKINSMIIESVSDANYYESYIDTVILMNRINVSDTYRKDLSNLGNISSRYLIESYIDAEPISDTIKKELAITCEEAGVVLHENSHDAVNSIFDDIVEAALFDESYASKKEKANSLLKVAYDKSMNLLTFESKNLGPNDVVSGYSLIEDGLTFKEAYEALSEHASMTDSDFFESSDEEDVDSGLDELSNYVDDDDKDSDDDSKSDNKNIKSKKEVKSSDKSTTSSRVPQKPKVKNLSNKVQFAAQDAEVRQMQRFAKAKEKTAEAGRAIKAVAQLPLNVINDIKNQIKALDEKDMERRKAYMVSPGYRKKAFRNLKLAIMYGSAAQIKLSMIPTLAVIRHFSKKKDKFIQKELLRELTTEIKVCEAKIEDAQNAGDNNEKYRLIRLRDQLEQEKVRVVLNSKKM